MPTKRNLKEHAKFIDDLGGPAAVARLIANCTGERLTPQAISNWRTVQGVAWRFRPFLMEHAFELGIKVPKNFLLAKA